VDARNLPPTDVRPVGVIGRPVGRRFRVDPTTTSDCRNRIHDTGRHLSLSPVGGAIRNERRDVVPRPNLWVARAQRLIAVRACRERDYKTGSSVTGIIALFAAAGSVGLSAETTMSGESRVPLAGTSAQTVTSRDSFALS
jgi:hypothetical protein